MAFSRLLPRPHARPKDAKGATTARVIALANQKGGVAKTTTTLNLAVALKEKGKRVLVIDLDPQGNLTMSQGMNPDEISKSMCPSAASAALTRASSAKRSATSRASRYHRRRSANAAVGCSRAAA